MTSDRIDGEPKPARNTPREFLLRDPQVPTRRARRKRFAIRLMTGVFVAALAVVATRLLTAEWVKDQSYTATMLHDLERLIEAQSAYHAEQSRFAGHGELGVAFVPSQAVHVTIVAADQTGWHAYATHLRSTDRCTVSVGTGPSVLRNMPSARATCASP